MTTPTIQLEDLLDLREELRAAGFDAGLQRAIAAHNLLLALAAQGRLPPDPRAWRMWLAPVFCAAPNEQEEFYRRYDKWIARRPALAEQTEKIELAQTVASVATEPTQVRSSAFKRLLPVAAVMILLALLAAYWLQRPMSQTLRGQVFSENETQPLPQAQVEFAGQSVETDGAGRFAFSYQTRRLDQWRQPNRLEPLKVTHDEHFQRAPDVSFYRPTEQKIVLTKRGKGPADAVPTVVLPTPTPTPPIVQTDDTSLKLWQLALIVLPLALYGLWLLVSWMRRQALLEKLPHRKVPQLRSLKVEGVERKLFASARVRRMLLGLRRPRPMSALALNVAATVRATIKQGGLFTPAYAMRRTSPEYLLLIDRASAHDEQANVGDELRQRLAENGVFVEPYYFQGDARACRSVLRDEAAVSLPQLAARYPEHRLLVFGDGAGFFEPFTGHPQRWLEQFALWEQRVLLTPEAPARWGYRERELSRREFMLLPANAEGLADLGEWLSYGLMPAPEKPYAAPFPEVIEERAHRWVERLAPQPDEIDELHDQTRAYLGAEGWDWLCACAVYPQVTWELTLCHGYWLYGGDAEWRATWDERVLRLVRLPWFRHGTMPDWWRARLLNEWQDPSNETKTRRGIERLLWSAINEPDEPVTLEYAEPEAQGFAARVRAWWQRQRLFQRLRTQDDLEDPARDTVFLRFLAGQRPPRLGVNVPDALRRLLFKDGQAALGWHPVTLGVMAGLLSLAMLLSFVWLNRKDLPKQPDPDVTPTPLARPTVSPNVLVTPPSPSPTVVLAAPAASPSQSPGGTLTVREGKDGYVVELGNNLTMELVDIAGGAFTMGADKSEFDDERPTHRVSVAPFNLGKTEVTQGQWQAVMGGENPSRFIVDLNRPVERVSWNDAVKFCERLSQLTGKQFRLPTEAEWEYAARAGTTTEYSFGDDEKLLGNYAWFRDNSGSRTHPVGKKLANQFGLFDMHGNVWEWCQDVWHDNYQGAPTDGSAWLKGGDSKLRVLRGGSWDGDDSLARAADRVRNEPGAINDAFGFRIAVSARTP